MVHVIAVDLGAESGRVTRVEFDGERVRLEEVHRFPNVPVQAGGTLHWDVLRLWREIVTGVEGASAGAAARGGAPGGRDFARVDRSGKQIGNPPQ